MRIGVLITHIRTEEKLLLAALRDQGAGLDVLLDRDLLFDLNAGPGQASPAGLPWQDYDLVLERCVSTSRGLYALAILNSWGIHTINSYRTASLCADKLRTSLAFANAGLPQPQTLLSFEPRTTLRALDSIGYPAVLKPVTGSWGRLLARVNDVDAAEALIEHRQTLGDYNHHVYYSQELVDKPGRDIRAFFIGERTACAIYRTSPHWITNTARGGVASNCPVTPELDELCRRAAAAVGGGLLAIDVLEAPDGQLMLIEINHTMEFRNSSAPTGVDIPAQVAEYVMSQARIPA